jgi:hypothetical protein
MTSPKRRGRPPSVWRDPIGYKFVEAVAHEKYRNPALITTGRAIRNVLKQPEFAQLRKYANGTTRYVEKQLIDVADYFGMHRTTRELIGRTDRLPWLKQNRNRSALAGGEDVLLLALILLDALALAAYQTHPMPAAPLGAETTKAR